MKAQQQLIIFIDKMKITESRINHKKRSCNFILFFFMSQKASVLLLCFRASQLLQENMTLHCCVSYKTILSLKNTSDFHKLNKQHFI